MNKSFDWFAATTFLVFTVIFWGIGFISLQWYSADARNSKRASDINTINSALITQLAQGQSVLSFVNENIDNKIDSKVLSIWWRKETSATDYNAWTVNYAALPVRELDFMDPIGVPYVIWVTTRINSKFEIASNMEQWNWNYVARLVWNYVARIYNQAVCSKVEKNANQLNIESNYINMFSVWDYITVKTDNWDIKTKIKYISTDWTLITLNDTVTNPTIIKLSEFESIWLIDQKDDDWKSWDNFITNGWYSLPY